MLSNETIRELQVVEEGALNLAQLDKFRDVFSQVNAEFKEVNIVGAGNFDYWGRRIND